MKEEDLKMEIIKIEAFADGVKQGAILLAQQILKKLEKQNILEKEIKK